MKESRPTRFLTALSAMLGLLALQGFGGTMPIEAERAIGSSTLILILFLGLPHRTVRERVVAVAACAAVLYLQARTEAAFTRSVLQVAALMLVGPPSSVFLGAALLGVTTTFALLASLPIFGDTGIWIATRIGRFVEREDVVLGPSALGLPAVLFLLLTLFWLQGTRRCWTWRAALAAMPILGWVAAPLAWNYMASYGWHDHDPPSFFHVPVIAGFALLVAALAWMQELEVPSLGEHPTSRWRTPALPWGLALGAVIGMHLDGWRSLSAPDRRLAFVNSGGIDWVRPSLDNVAYPASTGMFGLLPDHLRLAGWQTEAIAPEDVRDLTVAQARVLVIINCFHPWNGDERRALESFVSSGGTILALGDHTDVFGLMGGMNSLLEPWGIRFRFDSAYHAGSGWAGDLAWVPGTLGLGLDPSTIGLSIGAALDVEFPARPVVRARYAFSDTGERENVMGAFLGNYEHDPGELLGDLTVVAARRIGKGEVVVFGDTSGFQNIALEATFEPFVRPLLERLARPRAWGAPAWMHLLVTLALAALCACFLWQGRDHPWPRLIGLGAGLCLVALSVELWDRSRPAAAPESALDRGRLLIDEGVFPDIGHFGARWNTIIPLSLAAQRAGMLVQRVPCGERRAPEAGTTVAWVAPRKRLDDQDLAWIWKHLELGNDVLIAASGRDTLAVEPLFARIGVEMTSASLGSVPAAGSQDPVAPRFVDPSPVRVAAGVPHEVLYRSSEHMLATVIPIERGRLWLVGDSRFFSYQNVEGLWGTWPGNIQFLWDMLVRTSGARREPLGDTFEAPDQERS